MLFVLVTVRFTATRPFSANANTAVLPSIPSSMLPSTHCDRRTDTLPCTACSGTVSLSARNTSASMQDTSVGAGMSAWLTLNSTVKRVHSPGRSSASKTSWLALKLVSMKGRWTVNSDALQSAESVL